MNTQLEEKLKSLPLSPGVYFHKSATGEVIYVGKAAILKNRVRQYFQVSRPHDNKTMALVAEIVDTEWIETESEVDALFLESEMVKRYMPRYNVLLRDDKSQSFVRIDMKSEWPIVSFTRNPADDGAEYYGPFYNGFALKRALRYLRRIFPYLTKEIRPGQSKLDEDIGLSPRLSDGPMSYKADLRQLISYIKGNRKKIVRELEQTMKLAAAEQDFEKAAKLRNRLLAMQELQRRVSFGDKEHLDISKDQALSDITDILGLPTIPARIEGFDISHTGGRGVVASMVVFTNGVSNRAEYRKFKVSEKNDDTGNIYEALSRRLSERNIKSWGTPDLLLIDGGKGQLMAAIRARDEKGLDIPIISVAKRQEELMIHRNSKVIVHESILTPELGASAIPEGDFIVINLQLGRFKVTGHAKNFQADDKTFRYSDITKLIQRIRDESHRFAISYHETISRTRQKKSAFDDIAGVGPVTKRRLMRAFGSIAAIQKATETDIAKAVGPAKAKIIHHAFTGETT